MFVLGIAGCTGMEISGPTSIDVGTGQFQFEPVEEGEKLPIVAGPQGGYHVWLAVRVHNMDPRQLRLDSQLYDAEPPEDTGMPLEPDPVGESFFFYPPFFEDDDGVWFTAGIPHQVERSEVRNKLLRLEVLATDRDDRTATGDMIIVPIRVSQ